MFIIALLSSLCLHPSDTLPREEWKYNQFFRPAFPGGQGAIQMFLERHSGYPDSAKLFKHRGTLAVRFTVMPDSSLKDAEIYGTNPGFGLDKEALRLVSLMPPWVPRRQNTRNVADRATLYFRFDQNTWNVAMEQLPVGDIFRHCEELPRFPGGDSALHKFIADNLQYPPDALARGISGTVRIAYMLTFRKIMADIHPVGPELGGGLEAEALRIAHILPAWKGARSAGRDLPFYDTLDIHFVLPPKK